MHLVGLGYFALLGLLALHGAHRWLSVFRVIRYRTPPPAPILQGELPFITVQLPVFNERDVVARLVAAAAELDWPLDRLEVQLLDDSTDDTPAAAAPAVARARAAGVTVHVLRRGTRVGFKAGALAAGMATARGELMVIFDADFVPPADFLRRLALHFADPAVGMVQARWGHTNPNASWLTRAQARLLDTHFGVEHLGRSRAGLWFNFNGTAGIWRRTAIDQAGGWQGDTLTEDLDLSYRAQLAGWRFVYRDDVVVPAELPASLPAFCTQQRRWAKGSLEVLRKLGRRILAADVPWAVRAEALHHLVGNLAWPAALGVALLMPIIAGFGGVPVRWGNELSLAALIGATLSHAAFLLVGGAGRRRDTLPALVLGVGLAVSQSAAVLDAVLGRRSAFLRTPKAGGGRGSYLVSEAAGFPLELAVAAWQLIGLSAALTHGNFRAIPFLLWFAVGFAWVGVGQLRRSAPSDTWVTAK